jgi:hypothetical protein
VQELEFEELALYLITLIIVCIVGCALLSYQCRKLYGLLNKKDNEVTTTTTASDDDDDDDDICKKGLQLRRTTANKTQAQLAEEIRTLAQMQVELTSQLVQLRKVLNHTNDSEQHQETQVEQLKQAQQNDLANAMHSTDGETLGIERRKIE